MKALRRKLIVPKHDFIPGLPKGLKLTDGPDYLLSRTYERLLGTDLPRREILTGLSATMALSLFAPAPAHSVAFLPAVVMAVALVASHFNVDDFIEGTFEVEKDEEVEKIGYIKFVTSDDKTEEVEGSKLARYVLPPASSLTLSFSNGPSATTTGDKTFTVFTDTNYKSAFFVAV